MISLVRDVVELLSPLCNWESPQYGLDQLLLNVLVLILVLSSIQTGVYAWVQPDTSLPPCCYLCWAWHWNHHKYAKQVVKRLSCLRRLISSTVPPPTMRKWSSFWRKIDTLWNLLFPKVLRNQCRWPARRKLAKTMQKETRDRVEEDCGRSDHWGWLCLVNEKRLVDWRWIASSVDVGGVCCRSRQPLALDRRWC